MGPGPPRSNDREGVLRSNVGDGLVGVRSSTYMSPARNGLDGNSVASEVPPH